MDLQVLREETGFQDSRAHLETEASKVTSELRVPEDHLDLQEPQGIKDQELRERKEHLGAQAFLDPKVTPAPPGKKDLLDLKVPLGYKDRKEILVHRDLKVHWDLLVPKEIKVQLDHQVPRREGRPGSECASRAVWIPRPCGGEGKRGLGHRV
ncbi:hypothetical protein D5F01_LYC01435 [Larimichthys crocea]|uniref:Uncharacterized protein n=1 Tax=Larimichthys crocea TaxID=215358 RepID=A0A6G0J685_LARCR|nr:hypothetical protein D5F01_LYC01435 [Larimichthys crocea]